MSDHQPLPWELDQLGILVDAGGEVMRAQLPGNARLILRGCGELSQDARQQVIAAAEARGAAAERERVVELAEEAREADETARRTAFSAADLDELTIRADTLIGWDVALREFLRRLEEA